MVCKSPLGYMALPSLKKKIKGAHLLQKCLYFEHAKRNLLLLQMTGKCYMYHIQLCEVCIIMYVSHYNYVCV